MLIGFLIVVGLAGFVLEGVYRFIAFALLWTLPILAALAAMQFSLALHPKRPEEVFAAFVLAALAVRLTIGALVSLARNSAP